MNKSAAACLRSLVPLSAWALGLLGAALPADAQQTYYIYADHLDTPRLIENQSQQVVWRWDNHDPFGGNMANANPSGLGAFEFNLRFPGQYFDKETNQHYNYFRDYSPEIGMYIQSDPIGLIGLLDRGGLLTNAGPEAEQLKMQFADGLSVLSLSLYTYVGSSPLSQTDRLGLANDPSKPSPLPEVPRPPKGIPQQTLPPPVPPTPPAKPSCNQLYRVCMGACLPRCPGPLVVKAVACGSLCVSSWLIRRAGGGED